MKNRNEISEEDQQRSFERFLKESEQPPKENKFSIGNQPDIISAGMEMFGKVKEPAHTVDNHELAKRFADKFSSSNINIEWQAAFRGFLAGRDSVSPSPERGESDGWTLSRERMPEFDGSYYVYGFMHHECGNVTPFYKSAECRMNQWVKSDVGEQYTYWRKHLSPPENEPNAYKLKAAEQEVKEANNDYLAGR